MNKVREKFDEWAQNGKAELMEKEHGKNVLKFLRTVHFGDSFTFLDVGCGNGWVVRKMAGKEECKKAVGIDISKKMIMQARKKIKNKNEKFYATDIESWRYGGKFDFIFSMEVLYYANSIETALDKIYRLLKPGGQFFCGTDFYADNKATSRWPKMMELRMHLLSKKEWRGIFQEAGFEAKTRQIKDVENKKIWKREFGTLFITGTKPSK